VTGFRDAGGGYRDDIEEHNNDCVCSVDGVPQEAAPDPDIGVKTTTLIKSTTVVPHWRIRPKIDTLDIEVSASGGNTTFFMGGVAVAPNIVLFFCRGSVRQPPTPDVFSKDPPMLSPA